MANFDFISNLHFDPLYIEYAFSAIFLLVACFHSLVYSSVYTLSMITVIVQGEKGKVDKASTRIVAFLLCTFYILYNSVVYFVVLSTVDFNKLFVGRIFARSVFDHKWAFFLFYEPIVQLMTTWFKIGCACHSLMNQPSLQQVSGNNILSLVKKKSKNKHISELPQVTVVMPIYNEPLPSFMAAVNSVVETVYPNHRMHLVLAFDDDNVTPLYRSVIHCLVSAGELDIEATKKKGKYALDRAYDRIAKRLAEQPVPFPDESYPHIQDIDYRGLRVTPCRFKHGGKRHAQMLAYKYLVDRYGCTSQKPLLLFIDSDIQLDPYAINYFVYDLTMGKHREALTGLITCKTADTYNFLKILQDTEYIESQMMQRTTEDYLGSVSCLPGALTMVRFESLQSVADEYFDQMNSTDSLDFARTHLGEDRYFTHLLMEKQSNQYRIGYCSAARCKTEGCSSLHQLLKQRRRWYLGTLANEIHMLCSPILWRHVPGLLILQLLTSLKNGPLFLYVFMSEQFLGRGSVLTLATCLAIFLPIWLFVAGFGIKIHRRKITWCYPFIVILLPLMSACFQLYGVWTLRVRSWGGPRAVEAKAAGTPRPLPSGNPVKQQTPTNLKPHKGTSDSVQSVSIPVDFVEGKTGLNKQKASKTAPADGEGPPRPRLTIQIPGDSEDKKPVSKWTEIQVRNPVHQRRE
uniref:chitin synthase n=1 Tax=Spongospora subterranea TaxID=70186 RepID=A0A0H5RDJ9_9EUKA|eukprot:CRZ11816.1 hypothetical protein [Spongospora subterranea]